MRITFIPMRRDDRLEVLKAGETLVINGESFDLSMIPYEPSQSAADLGCPWIVGMARQISGELMITMILPHGGDAPHETLFPETITITQDGPIPIPAYNTVTIHTLEDSP